MRLIGGVVVLAIIVLVALHCVLPKRNIVRFICCLGVSVIGCITGTMHGVFFGILLLALEIIWNTLSKTLSKYSSGVK